MTYAEHRAARERARAVPPRERRTMGREIGHRALAALENENVWVNEITRRSVIAERAK